MAAPTSLLSVTALEKWQSMCDGLQVGNKSIKYGSIFQGVTTLQNDDKWTKALKLMLTNVAHCLKWMVAWQGSSSIMPSAPPTTASQ